MESVDGSSAGGVVVVSVSAGCVTRTEYLDLDPSYWVLDVSPTPGIAVSATGENHVAGEGRRIAFSYRSVSWRQLFPFSLTGSLVLLQRRTFLLFLISSVRH